MKLNISKTIDENIIGVDISVAELGTLRQKYLHQ